MSYVFRKLLLAVVCSAALAGCGGSGSGRDDAKRENPSTPDKPAANALVVSLSTPTVFAKANGGTQKLQIVFASSDGKPVTDLSVSGLQPLPAGWGGVSEFSCSTAATGDSCVLNLTYAPAAPASGSLSLTYSYKTNLGDTLAGTIDMPYSATSDNNIVATYTPTGQVVGIIGQAAQSVAIRFGSDDNQTITALQLTTNLSALPAEWSVLSNGLPCAQVDADHACTLTLNYAPTTIGSGALTFNYEYVDNSGAAKQGTVSIPYAAAASNSIVASVSSARIDARLGASKQATVTFTTNDGNPASDLALAAPLPPSWNLDLSACTHVDGNGCQATLSYAPTTAASGTLSFAYSYNDNAGQAKTGSFNVSYLGRDVYAYIAADLGLKYCAIDVTGALSNCQDTTAPLTLSRGIVFHDGDAYVSNVATGDVARCQVGANGDLVSCQNFASGIDQASQMAATDSHLYVISPAPSTHKTSACSFADGSCAQQPSTASNAAGIVLTGQFAYISIEGAGTVQLCTIQANGDLGAPCFNNAAFGDPAGMAADSGFLYVTDRNLDQVSQCTIAVNGGLSACTNTLTVTDPRDIKIVGTHAYVLHDSGVTLCNVASGGQLQSCSNSNGGASFFSPLQITID